MKYLVQGLYKGPWNDTIGTSRGLCSTLRFRGSVLQALTLQEGESEVISARLFSNPWEKYVLSGLDGQIIGSQKSTK